jgi:hypothetical protein
MISPPFAPFSAPNVVVRRPLPSQSSSSISYALFDCCVLFCCSFVPQTLVMDARAVHRRAPPPPPLPSSLSHCWVIVASRGFPPSHIPPPPLPLHAMTLSRRRRLIVEARRVQTMATVRRAVAIVVDVVVRRAIAIVVDVVIHPAVAIRRAVAIIIVDVVVRRAVAIIIDNGKTTEHQRRQRCYRDEGNNTIARTAKTPVHRRQRHHHDEGNNASSTTARCLCTIDSDLGTATRTPRHARCAYPCARPFLTC